MERAIFAGGCFWCVEYLFDGVEGVEQTVSGYIGGHKVDPTYEEVCSGTTGHTEAVEVMFDPAKVSYEELLRIFWQNIDPTTPNRQFCDVGTQYRAGIFYLDQHQQELAEASRQQVVDSKNFPHEVVTEITPASHFYPAEDYHQNFHKTNSDHYKAYHYGSGRQRRLDELWGPKK
ncbi:MAG: peptide-methionine (S)-S-oxide reductase MsrA [Magnetococcales bacterium]|nr:peptide-methionine (S)-S-oxide reductase MsrA [Magnetococcales bacterium]